MPFWHLCFKQFHGINVNSCYLLTVDLILFSVIKYLHLLLICPVCDWNGQLLARLNHLRNDNKATTLIRMLARTNLITASEVWEFFLSWCLFNSPFSWVDLGRETFVFFCKVLMTSVVCSFCKHICYPWLFEHSLCFGIFYIHLSCLSAAVSVVKRLDSGF